MAQSNFHSVQLEKATVQAYLDNTDCQTFVFQQILEDDDKNDKDFILGFYALKNDGTSINSDIVLLVKTTETPINGKKKKKYGNMPITKLKLESLFGSDTKLLFRPREFGDYIAYTINVAATTPYALDPSPPAPPPTDAAESESKINFIINSK